MYGAINWLKAMNLWEGPELDLGNLALFVQIAIAFTGLVWQFTHGFGLPWFLQIPLFPLSVIEWLLVHFIAA